MSTTFSSNPIVPEVFAGAVLAKVNGLLVFGSNFATRFPQLQGEPGDTINLVEFARLSELTSDQDEQVPLTPEALSSTAPQQLVIREASKAVEISERSNKTAFGNPIDFAQKEQARVISNRVDTVLRDAAYAAATLVDESANGPISAAAVDAAAIHYGDRLAAGDEAVALVINSAQFQALKYEATFERITDNQRPTGLVGVIDSVIPVFVSDLITSVDDGTNPVYHRALLFAGKPLALAHKQQPEIKTAEDILRRVTTVVTSYFYAGGAMTPANIVELRTQ